MTADPALHHRHRRGGPGHYGCAGRMMWMSSRAALASTSAKSGFSVGGWNVAGSAIGTPTCRNQRSCEPGRLFVEKSCPVSDPALRKVCTTPRGIHRNEPAGASIHSSPFRKEKVPEMM